MTGGLLTLDEYLALPETECGYSELQEGRVVMSPNEGKSHMTASGELYRQLSAHLPPHLKVIARVDIDLQLAAPAEPGSAADPT